MQALFHTKTNKTKDLNQVVAKIQSAATLDLDETDDFSSTWKIAQESGRVWGRGGFSGRGVNCGLETYKGKDAVVNALTLALSGKDLFADADTGCGERTGLGSQHCSAISPRGEFPDDPFALV